MEHDALEAVNRLVMCPQGSRRVTNAPGLALVTCPTLIAVKEASGRFDQATAILKSKRAGFSALSGEDALLLPLM